jgi:hypothetical protein
VPSHFKSSLLLKTVECEKEEQAKHQEELEYEDADGATRWHCAHP